MSFPNALLPALFVLLWSSAFVGAQFGLPYAEPLSFLFVRFVLVTAAFIAIAGLLKAPWPRSRKEFLDLALVGALVQGIYLSGVFVALARGLPAGLAALIVGVQPIVTALMAGPLLGDRVAVRQWLGLGLGILGVAMVLAERISTENLDLVGVGLCTGALLAISTGTIHQKKHAGSVHVATGSAVQNLAACGVTGVGVLLFESFRIDWTPVFLLSLGWLTIVVSLGAFSLLMTMIRSGAAVEVASLFYLVPPTTAVLAWLAFDERIAWVGVGGIVVATIGVAVTTRPGARPTGL